MNDSNNRTELFEFLTLLFPVFSIIPLEGEYFEKVRKDLNNHFCRESKIMENNLESMEFPEDPQRCQGTTPKGQCSNKGLRLPDGTCARFCNAHGGVSSLDSYNRESYRNYQLTKFQGRLERHAKSPQIKNLRDEIGILRMMMEEKLNACTDQTDLILQSGAISDLVLKIEKVVGSCHKLEGSMNQLLDKQAILQFANEMISIIGEEITDPVLLDKITTKLMALIGRTGTDEGIRNTDD